MAFVYFCHVGVEWVVSKGVKLLGGEVERRLPELRIEEIKERVVAVVKYPVQTEVVRGLSRVGAVVVWCVANLLAYTQIAQCQVTHPALGKYTSLGGFRDLLTILVRSIVQTRLASVALVRTKLFHLGHKHSCSRSRARSTTSNLSHFGAPEPLLHRHLEQLAEC
jgi:hypothetical protein